MSTERPIRVRWSWLALVALLVLGACSIPRPVTPLGFATYGPAEPFRAVSADDVLYRVRREANPGGAPPAFWKEALLARMSAAGYRVVAEAELVDASDQPGYLLELAAPLGTQDYGYLVGLFVRDEALVIVEAGGELARLSARRSALLAAIHATRF